MLELIKEYGQLINLTILMVIVGWLFRISSISRSSLIDKHQAELKTKEIQISSKNAELDTLKKRVIELEAKLTESEKLHRQRVEEINERVEHERRLENLGREAIERIGVMAPEKAIEQLERLRNDLESKIKSESIKDDLLNGLVKELSEAENMFIEAMKKDSLTPAELEHANRRVQSAICNVLMQIKRCNGGALPESLENYWKSYDCD